MKKAFITGITGQDGSYLAEYLLAKGYEVHGLVRRSSQFNRSRIEHLYFLDQAKYKDKLHLHYGDLSDSSSLNRFLEKYQPDEIYNLGAQSHVAISFKIPEYTADVNGLGTLRLLDAIRETKIKTKFYQASSSEIFGNAREIPQSETTPLDPCNPYACAKVYAYHITRIYREAYGIFACNGILFNHESPRRGESFVSRKITLSLSRIKEGLQDTLLLGNISASRDWGFAGEYVTAMWLMMQQEKPDDYVIASGKTHSVKEFVELAGSFLGFDIQWEGADLNQKGIDRKTNKIIVRIDKAYFRPYDIDVLLGDYSKARKILKWGPKVTFEELVKLMAEADLQYVREQSYGKRFKA
jgi:GDPmannose 4,6-dehydratase